jgi:hypothetical protein
MKNTPLKNQFYTAVSERDAEMLRLGVDSVFDERIRNHQGRVLAARAAIPKITCPEHGETMEIMNAEDGYALHVCSVGVCAQTYECYTEEWRERAMAGLPTLARRAIHL